MLIDLVSIESISLATQHLLLLLGPHLIVQSSTCFALYPVVLITTLIIVHLGFGITYRHLLYHDLLVSLCRILVDIHSLVIAVEFILGIVFTLIVLYLSKMLFSTVFIQIQLARLKFSKDFVSFSSLLIRLFLHRLLLVEGLSIILTFLCLQSVPFLIKFNLIALLVEISLLLNLPILFFLETISLCQMFLLFDRFAGLGANVITNILSLLIFNGVTLGFTLCLHI